MKIDDKKENTPYSETTNERTYTDHNTIIVQMNWITTSLVERKERLILNKRSKEKFKKETEQGELSKIWEEEGAFQQKYDTWNNEVKKIANKIFTTTKKPKKHKNRKIRKLRRKKKHLKEENQKEWSQINSERRKFKTNVT